MRECPNSYILPGDWELFGAWEASRATGQPWERDGLALMDARMAQAFVVLDTESQRLATSRQKAQQQSSEARR